MQNYTIAHTSSHWLSERVALAGWQSVKPNRTCNESTWRFEVYLFRYVSLLVLHIVGLGTSSRKLIIIRTTLSRVYIDRCHFETNRPLCYCFIPFIDRLCTFRGLVWNVLLGKKGNVKLIKHFWTIASSKLYLKTAQLNGTQLNEDFMN